jgi:hypothetical protein
MDFKKFVAMPDSGEIVVKEHTPADGTKRTIVYTVPARTLIVERTLDEHGNQLDARLVGSLDIGTWEFSPWVEVK